MKNLLILIIVFSLAAGGIMETAVAQQIDISESVLSQIDAVITTRKRIVPLDKELKDQRKKLLRTWVSGSIDIDKATKRVSKRYDRTTYTQIISREKTRFLNERLKLTPISEAEKKLYKPELQIQLIPEKQLENPVEVIYREGPMYFMFQTLKEQRAETSLTEAQISDLAKKFLIQNALLVESDKDKISKEYLRERRNNIEKGDSEDPDDYLLLQSIIFERKYDGNPVINSKIEIGIFPDNKEIFLLKHFNWTQVDESNAKQIQLQKQKRSSPNLKVDVQERLEQKIKDVSGTFTKAVVKKSFPAWFQTEDNLIPLIAFEIDIEYPSPKEPLKRTYLEVLNLVGDDRIFFKQHGTMRPTKAP
jgi:hypothetical protein